MAGRVVVCIVLLENTWPRRGGTSELLYNFAFGLVELGFQVQFASFINRYQTRALPLWPHHFYHDYATGLVRSRRSSKMAALSHLAQAVEINGNVVRANLSISFRRFLKSILKAHRTQVVLIGTCWPAPACVAAAKSIGIPTVQYLNAIESNALHGLSLGNRLLARWTEDVGISGSIRTTVVSQQDRTILLRRGFPSGQLVVIPNCVDCSKYESVTHEEIREVRRKLNAENRPIIVFVGGLDYPPNRLAVERIHQVIAPRVLRNVPEALFVIIGPDPPGEISHPSIAFTGGIYDRDLAAHVLAADVGIAPVEIGTGTRLKLLEYFSAGKPVVSTSIGAVGLDIQNGRDVLIRDDYVEFSNQVVFLIRNPSVGQALGQRAKLLTRQKYSREVLARALGEVLHTTVLEYSN